jgi:hypothetical protein
MPEVKEEKGSEKKRSREEDEDFEEDIENEVRSYLPALALRLHFVSNRTRQVGMMKTTKSSILM